MVPPTVLFLPELARVGDLANVLSGSGRFVSLTLAEAPNTSEPQCK